MLARCRSPYKTRHTYASMMLSAGEHQMWVANQMGHIDWAMITRVCGRWMPAVAMIAAKRAVQMWTTDGKHDNIGKTYNRCSDEYSSARWASTKDSRFLQKNIIRSTSATER